MNTPRKAHIRLALSVSMVVVMLALAPSPSSLEASRIEKNLGAVAGPAIGNVWVTLYNDKGGYTDVT